MLKGNLNGYWLAKKNYHFIFLHISNCTTANLSAYVFIKYISPDFIFLFLYLSILCFVYFYVYILIVYYFIYKSLTTILSNCLSFYLTIFPIYPSILLNWNITQYRFYLRNFVKIVYLHKVSVLHKCIYRTELENKFCSNFLKL